MPVVVAAVYTARALVERRAQAAAGLGTPQLALAAAEAQTRAVAAAERATGAPLAMVGRV